MPAPQITTKLYGDKIEVKFYPDSHRYYVGGKSAPGVTTIIGIKDKSQALIPWAVNCFVDFLTPHIGNTLTEDLVMEGARQHTVYKKEAADFGTKIHNWVSDYIGAKITSAVLPEMPADKEVQIGVNAFLDWEKGHKVKFISSERPVYSKKHHYVGTLDIEAKIDGEICLVDLKSSNALYNTVNLQTAAYRAADEEESKKKYSGRWAVRLAKETEAEFQSRMAKKGREGKYQVFEAKFLDDDKKNYKRDFEAFLACLKLYQFEKETNVWLK
ncbi:MAG: hypothetical protein AAB456_00290 [Patescibacteria group bacterium]